MVQDYDFRALVSEDDDGPEPDDAAEFGRRLEAARARLGLPLNEVARRSGIQMQNLSKLRQGRRCPTVRTLRRLGAVLGVPWWELVGP